METLKRWWQNKTFRVFCWQLLDVIIVFWITYMSWLEWEWGLIATWLGIPVCTLISKYINKQLWDLGVDLPEKK